MYVVYVITEIPYYPNLLVPADIINFVFTSECCKCHEKAKRGVKNQGAPRDSIRGGRGGVVVHGASHSTQLKFPSKNPISRTNSIIIMMMMIIIIITASSARWPYFRPRPRRKTKIKSSGPAM
ncbi:PREDICTED: uncharacterized protein LOC105449906 [Wasmannia auropunctata]|uniref:uncharacterized protein LOC105449906 n=1 Tax=Wasmannia auropunctata TaxID=64793 RepID=UPI0005F09A63|nr:PREDICTED: uncharacterized protein LOC105449906 [Wasmannia auropunctata]